jgi:transcriptional regulator with XRE-family HTH domain
MTRPVSEGQNPIGQRLKFEMKKRGVTSAELAKRADVKTSFIYDVISGKSANPSTVKLARVAEKLGISLAYLVGSSQLPDLHTHSLDDAHIALPRIAVDATADGSKVISMLDQDSEPCLFRKAWIKEHLQAEVDDLRILNVRGDSMEPTLCHNDLILVDTSKKTPSPPGLFVLFDGFGLLVKRIEQLAQHQPPRLRIISDNAQYSTYERSADETFIIGRVVWFARGI